jgi:hypothetical protein
MGTPENSVRTRTCPGSALRDGLFDAFSFALSGQVDGAAGRSHGILLAGHDHRIAAEPHAP